MPFYSFYQKLLPLSPIEICPPLEQFLCSQNNVERRYFFIRLGFVRRETYLYDMGVYLTIFRWQCDLTSNNQTKSHSGMFEGIIPSK